MFKEEQLNVVYARHNFDFNIDLAKIAILIKTTSKKLKNS